jgi:hypothetical protein
VQAKVGTTKFSLVYNQIRQSAIGIRRKRKVASALLETTNPKAAAKRKIQKNVIKKDSRKRKDSGFLYVPFFFVKCSSETYFVFLAMARKKSSDLEKNNSVMFRSRNEYKRRNCSL